MRNTVAKQLRKITKNRKTYQLLKKKWNETPWNERRVK